MLTNPGTSPPSTGEGILAPRRSARLFLLPFLMLYVAVVVRTAWAMDDAYISFRSADNLVQGFGLRWNTFERVDPFTNPLWTLIVAAFTAVTREFFFTSILLEIVISSAAMVLLARGARSATLAAGCVVVLTLSKAFVDYSTSGLENPLSHLLVILFVREYLVSGDRSVASLGRLTLCAALAFVNRLDLVVVLAPALLETVWSLREHFRTGTGRRGLARAVAGGAAPFLAWELFSLFYYGALIPNSALAKLTSGVSRSALIWEGISYTSESLQIDPITLLVITFGALVAFAREGRRARALASGGLLTLVYVVWVGGDHMSGRFFSVPLVMIVAMLSRLDWTGARRELAAGAGLAVTAAWMGTFPTLSDEYFKVRDAVARDIEDYRRENYAESGLLSRNANDHDPRGERVDKGKKSREHAADVRIEGAMGFDPFYAGPQVRVIDKYGLTDPLLARLPVPDPLRLPWFKPGHFERLIPDGYQESLTTGENRVRHPALHAYFDKIISVTRGPLWSTTRLVDIVKLNVGAYNGLRDEYVAYQNQKVVEPSWVPPARMKNTDNPFHECPCLWSPCAESGVMFTEAGLRVRLGAPTHDRTIDVELEEGDFNVVLLQDSRPLYRTVAASVKGARIAIHVPEGQITDGYDAVSFVPVNGVGGHLSFFQTTR